MELGNHLSISLDVSDLNSSELSPIGGKATENRYCCLPAWPDPALEQASQSELNNRQYPYKPGITKKQMKLLLKAQ